MPEKLLTLKEYAKKINRDYLTVWRYYKKGELVCRKAPGGRLLVLKGITPKKPGAKIRYNRKQILDQVYRLCKKRYVSAAEFPPHLYKLCVSKTYGIGSIRAAKWEAKILNENQWTYPQFIACVNEFCKKRYRQESDWPKNMSYLAKQFCGSIRKAKWEAGVIRDRRKRKRKNDILYLWPKQKFLRWVRTFCKDRYKKPAQWPGYMRYLAVTHCNSIRNAKWQAKILKNQRKVSRKD